MSGWEVGDFALCVDTRRTPIPGRIGRGVAGLRYRKGCVYTVTAVGQHPKGYGEVLWLKEDESGLAAGAFRFIKVTPPEADEFDRETIDLMLGKPITQEQRNAEYFEKIEAQMRRQMQGDD